MVTHDLFRVVTRMVTLALLIAGLYFVLPETYQATAESTSDCYGDCVRVRRFCQEHPDGQYTNLDGINECNAFDFHSCVYFDCPTPVKYLFNPCIENPSRPGCEQPAGGGNNCPSIALTVCQDTCRQAATDNHTACVDPHLTDICFCTYGLAY